MTEASSNGGSSFFRKRRRVTEHAPPLSSKSFFDNPLLLQRTPPDAEFRPTTAVKDQDAAPLAETHSRHRRESSLSSLSELSSSLRRRSASLRSKRSDSPQPWDTLSMSDKRTGAARPQLVVSTLSTQASSDSVATLDRPRPTTSDSKYKGLPAAPGKGDNGKVPIVPPSAFGASMAVALPQSQPSNPQDTRTSIKRMRDIAMKRTQLMKYLRMIYSSETHWFNTYRITAAQIRNLPSMQHMRLPRRTQSLLILGLSIPFVLDPIQDTLLDYLRTFSSLLTEYETYLSHHPVDTPSSALSRARIPQMFKRSAVKGRRGSAADALSPQSAEDPRSASSNSSGLPSATWTSFPAATQDADLQPGEDYHFLLTPCLPFDTDYFETFATLCDILIDSYKHVIVLLDRDYATPEASTQGLSTILESFTKVDSKIKKLLLSGMVKEFEDTSRQGIRSELAGVGKLVMGGLT